MNKRDDIKAMIDNAPDNLLSEIASSITDAIRSYEQREQSKTPIVKTRHDDKIGNVYRVSMAHTKGVSTPRSDTWVYNGALQDRLGIVHIFAVGVMEHESLEYKLHDWFMSGGLWYVIDDEADIAFQELELVPRPNIDPNTLFTGIDKG